jgi:hypothetical protein
MTPSTSTLKSCDEALMEPRWAAWKVMWYAPADQPATACATEP